jgi:hypothetical protein
LELGCRKMQDRANHAVHTENPGHEADHPFGSGHTTSSVILTGDDLLIFCFKMGKVVPSRAQFARDRVQFDGISMQNCSVSTSITKHTKFVHVLPYLSPVCFPGQRGTLQFHEIGMQNCIDIY